MKPVESGERSSWCFTVTTPTAGDKLIITWLALIVFQVLNQ